MNISQHTSTNRNGDLLDAAAERGDVYIAAPTDYTRYDHGNRNPSVIDLAITSVRHATLINRIEVLQDIQGSDHRPVLYTINEKIHHKLEQRRPNFFKADWTKFREEINDSLTNAPETKHDKESLDRCVDFITKVICQADGNNIPRTRPNKNLPNFYDHIKNLPTDGLDYIAAIYQACLETCYFSDDWKSGQVKLIPKPNKDHSQPQNYRPTTLLPALGKILERVINEIVTAYAESNGIITDTQAAYRKCRSTQDQLYRITEDASRSVATNAVTIATLFVLKGI